jgi:hypothetical protein
VQAIASGALQQEQHVSERRGRENARPGDLNRLLSFEQNVTLTSKEQFGWTIAFVRRPLFQQIEVVITNPDKTDYLAIQDDGSTRPFYNIRTDDLR